MSSRREAPGVLSDLRDAASGRPAADVLDEVARDLQAARSFIVASHVNPDGDALGSLAAIGLILRSLGKEARVVTGQALPEKYRPFFPPDLPEVMDIDGAARLAKPDICLLIDTAAPERAGIFQDIFFAPGQRRICMDHHLPGPVRHYDRELVVTEAPSTGNLVLALADALGVPIDGAMAHVLWIAIATDTGWFRFANTTPWALGDAARLAAHGLDTESLHERIYQSLTIRSGKLLGAVLAGAREDLGGDLLWSSVSRAHLSESGLELAELDGFIDYLKGIRGPRFIALIVETEPGKHKVSLRARGDADVEAVARRLGGGGHSKAAGYRAAGSIADVVSALRGVVAERTGREG